MSNDVLDKIIIYSWTQLSKIIMKQQDCLVRFLFEEYGVRGEWVRLQDSWQQAKQYQVLVNEAVESQLGQALAAVVLLSATIKFTGAMIMQIQGSGELKALVSQSTNERKIRGLVRSEPQVSADNLKDMIGEGGRLVLTIESENAEPYQGIIALDEPHLADVLKAYFNQSEQLGTSLWLFANKAYAAGLFLQQLPGNPQEENGWEHLQILAETLTADELFNLDCEDLLHRLFNAEKVMIYPAETIEFKCTCSRTKISGTLAAFGRDELQSILLEREFIEVDCQFCGAQYSFDKVDVEQLLINPLDHDAANLTTKH